MKGTQMKLQTIIACAVTAAAALLGGCSTCGGRAPAACACGGGDPIYVLCRFDLKQGKAADYTAAINAISETVRAEKGCRFYTLVGDATTGMPKQQKFGPDVLWMLECWDDEAALKAHLESPHMKAFGPKARELRNSGTFHVLKEMK